MFCPKGPFKPFGIIAAALISGLSGCTTKESAGAIFVSPNTYMLYACRDLVVEWNAVQRRQRELDALMAQAAKEGSGRFVSALVYEPEYTTLNGNLYRLRQEAAAKQCTLPDNAGATKR